MCDNAFCGTSSFGKYFAYTFVVVSTKILYSTKQLEVKLETLGENYVVLSKDQNTKSRQISDDHLLRNRKISFIHFTSILKANAKVLYIIVIKSQSQSQTDK